MVGETLLVLQRFEQLLIVFLLSAVSARDADAKLEAALLRDKSTLGTLVRLLSERVELPSGFAATFEGLLEKRNVFVHKLFMAPWFDLQSEQGRQKLDAFLREIRAELKIALHVLITAARVTPPGQNSAEGESRMATILARITATVNPYFGALTPDEYVEKVVHNALTQYAVQPRKALD